MTETLTLAVTGLLLCNILAEPVYRKRTTSAGEHLSYAALLAALLIPLLFGRWNTPLPWLLVLGFALIDFIAAFISSPFTRFAFRHLSLAALAVSLSVLDPTAAHGGLWFDLLRFPRHHILFWRCAAIASGILLCVFTGGSLVQAVIRQLLSEDQLAGMQGLPNGGRIIGWLERSIVMLLIWMQQAEGIGFLVAAKSILRFDDIHRGQQRTTTEYVIIGTFLSFGWAMFVTMLLQAALRQWPG